MLNNRHVEVADRHGTLKPLEGFVVKPKVWSKTLNRETDSLWCVTLVAFAPCFVVLEAGNAFVLVRT